MALEIELFPPAAMALQEEIRNHPILVARLAAMPESATLQDRTATILTYCNMVVDGYYSNAQLMILFDHMLVKLKTMSTLHIN